MVRHWTPKPVIICSIRSSPTGGNFFFAVVKSFEYKIAISAKFVQTVKNLTKCLPSAKRLPTTLSLASAKFLVIDKYLIDMTEMSFSNNFWLLEMTQVVYFPRSNEIKFGI